MPSVSVTINGKNYRMACDEGQETHLEALAKNLDGYVSHLKGSFGEIGDQRLVVMASIMVMDELQELKKKHSLLEKELDSIKNETDLKSREREDGDDELARAISEAASRIEAIGRKVTKPNG